METEAAVAPQALLGLDEDTQAWNEFQVLASALRIVSALTTTWDKWWPTLQERDSISPRAPWVWGREARGRGDVPGAVRRTGVLPVLSHCKSFCTGPSRWETMALSQPLAKPAPLAAGLGLPCVSAARVCSGHQREVLAPTWASLRSVRIEAAAVDPPDSMPFFLL